MSLESDRIIERIAQLKEEEEPFVLATVVRTENATSAKAGAKAVIRADGSMTGWIGGGCTAHAAKKAAAEALRDGKARLIRVRPKESSEDIGDRGGIERYDSACPSGGTVEIFVEPMLPRPLLVIAGASPTAAALCELGRRMGFAVTLAALAEDHDSLPPADARLDGFRLERIEHLERAFIVVATQGKRDAEALAEALASPAAYVAFIGSRRKAAALKARLIEQGLPAKGVARLRAPAGLDIGAITPEEIALSILAEIVVERRRGLRAEQEALGDPLAAGETRTRVLPGP